MVNKLTTGIAVAIKKVWKATNIILCYNYTLINSMITSQHPSGQSISTAKVSLNNGDMMSQTKYFYVL